MTLGKVAGFALGPIGTSALSLITVPLIAWNYSPDDVGRIAMLQVGISFCLLLFSLGLDQAYVRDYHLVVDKANLFRVAIRPGLALLIMTLVAVLICWPKSLSHLLFDRLSLIYSLLIGFCFLGAFISRFLSLMLRMQGRAVAFSISQILPKFLSLVVIVSCVFISDNHDFYQLLLANVIAFVSVAIYLAWLTREEWRNADTPSAPNSSVKLLHFGGPLVFSGLAYWGIISFDKIFLRHYGTYVDIGLYSVATSFAGAAGVLQAIFSTIWAPKVYEMHGNGVEPSVVHRASEIVLAVVVIVFCLMGMTSWVMVYILPIEYHAAHYLLTACMAFPLFYTLSEATGIGVGVMKKSILAMIATLTSLFVNVMLNIFLVPNFGASGAAAALAISFFSLVIIRTEFSVRVWFNFSRRKIYTYSFAVTAISVSNAITRGEYNQFVAMLWLTLLVVVIVDYFDALKGVARYIYSKTY